MVAEPIPFSDRVGAGTASQEEREIFLRYKAYYESKKGMRYHLFERDKLIAMAVDSGLLQVHHFEGHSTALLDTETGEFLKPIDARVQIG